MSEMDSSPSPETKPPAKSAPFRAGFGIIALSLAVALASYSVQQYTLRQDEEAGAAKRVQQETSDAHSPASDDQKQFLEEQRHLAKMLGDSLQRNPQDTSILLSLSSARIASGDTLGALKILDHYVHDVNPSNIAAQTDYGYLLFISGDVKAGTDLTLNVLKKDPKNQIALYNMAAMSYHQENLPEAMQWMQKCIRADTASEIGHLAGMALAQLEAEAKKSGKD